MTYGITLRRENISFKLWQKYFWPIKLEDTLINNITISIEQTGDLS